jgi:antitoxin VapB
VLLPAEFRFSGRAVFIRRDAASGDVILSSRPDTWEGFFELADRIRVPSGFMAKRADSKPQRRRLL